MYFWLVLSGLCILYYIICACYAGISSSFIFIWLIGAALFGGLFAVSFLESAGIFALNPLIKHIGAGILALLFLLFFVLEGIIIKNMFDKPDKDCDYMIVLGCQIRGTNITRSLRRRLETALNYANENEHVVIIVSGGQGRGEDMSEAQAMHKYLTEHGIDGERIIMEDKSTDTNLNMRYSASYIKDKDSKVCVVTNTFHIYRAKKLARAQGFTNVSGAAAASDKVLLLNYMVREAIGIVKDFTFGNF